MKFAEHLGAHITPEWRKQYIQYEVMKDMLYDVIEAAPSAETIDAETIERYFARFEESFYQYCDKELLKINTFFSEKLAEATRKMANLKSDLTAAKEAHEQHQHAHSTKQTQQQPSATSAEPSGAGANLRRRSSILPKIGNFGEKSRMKKSNIKNMHEIKLAFSEFYLSLILLQNYQTLNFTGFRKILKKHDKLLETDRGAHWRQEKVETAQFYTSKQVDHLIKETEGVFTSRLEGGDRQKAMKRLRVPPLGEQQNPWTTFRVGLFSGIFVVLLIVCILAAIFTSSHHANDWEAALRMYRGTFLVFLIILLLGINTYGWRASGVNHVLIFELDPRDNLTHQQLLEVAGFFLVVWATSVVSYLLSDFIHIPVFANPLCLVGFCLLYLLNPIPILHYTARKWLLRILVRIVTAPFHHVGFADFWLADQLNSLSMVISDFEFLICFYATNIDWTKMEMKPEIAVNCGGVTYGIPAVVACLPAWFRFAQCLRRYRDTRLVFPHIVNAGKYSTTFFVVIFSSLNSHYKNISDEDVSQNNPFFWLWIVSAVISTCYTFTWDIKMDWGLMDLKNAGENKFLREEIVYAYKWYYYFAIIQDFILRFAWTITVSVGEGNLLHGEIIKSILGPCEVFRRFVWNFFRLENEHLNNCGQFRAVRDISIAPIDANDQALLEKMMDEDDGVSNRNKGNTTKKHKYPGGRTMNPIGSMFNRKHHLDNSDVYSHHNHEYMADSEDQIELHNQLQHHHQHRQHQEHHIPWARLIDSTVSTSAFSLMDIIPYPHDSSSHSITTPTTTSAVKLPPILNTTSVKRMSIGANTESGGVPVIVINTARATKDEVQILVEADEEQDDDENL